MDDLEFDDWRDWWRQAPAELEPEEPKPKTRRADRSSKRRSLRNFLGQIPEYLKFGKSDSVSREELVLSCTRFAMACADKFTAGEMGKDLFQVGCLGLLIAVDQYDPTKASFFHYSQFWVRAGTGRYYRNQRRLVSPSHSVRQKGFKLLKEDQDIPCTDLARELGISEWAASRLIGWWKGQDSPEGLEDIPEDPYLAEHTEEDEHVTWLQELFGRFRATLSERNAEIFRLRFLEDPPHTLQEIGDAYKLSRERVRQIEAGMLGRLPKWFKEQGVWDELVRQGYARADQG
jgi:RNA polymerase sigma factor (sigma-70 family)